MRSLRWLLLVAMVLVAAVVVRIYQIQRTTQRDQQRPLPSPVSLDTRTMARDWEWGQSGNGQPQVKLKAKTFRQSADSSKMELEQIELRIYQKDGTRYDRVRSAAAQFSTSDNKLFSPGEAEITLDVPVAGEATHQLTSITTSGINFDSRSGQATTTEHVAFSFESGSGTCKGAAYDPATHSLTLVADVVMNLRGKGPNAKPIKVEAGQLAWSETGEVLVLLPWSRFTRDQNVIDAANSTVKLKDGGIDWIDTLKGHGIDKQPNRQLEYSADAFHVSMSETGEMEKLSGTGNARLVAQGTGARTTVTGNLVELAFVEKDGESVLNTATAKGKSALESKPLPDPRGNTPDTKILRADALDLQMKPGGKDLDRVRTQVPGVLEFQPNQITRHRRVLRSDQMLVVYGAKNEIQTFHAVGAATETEPSEDDRRRRKAGLATAFTSSRLLDAAFDENGQLKQLKQAENFRYTEGERSAQADTATMESERNVMDLEAHARIADSTGATSADHIQLDQTTGDFDARGHASTTRAADGKQSDSGMLDGGEPTQGTADRVTTANRNRLVHYNGHAVVWQTSNRIQGDRIDIDREAKTLTAEALTPSAKVVTQFQDKGKSTFTIVKSQRLVYTDQDRLASYSGGVDFWRPALTVKSAALKAWLNQDGAPGAPQAESRLNRAIGDGHVEIVQFAADRQRIGNSEHAEYYTDEGKIILTGASPQFGLPQLNDSKRGNTRGEKLTWFTDDNRLLVDGAPGTPGTPDNPKTQSHIRKKS